MIQKNRLVKLTQDLIRIESENPPGKEYRIVLFVRNRLKRMGLDTRLYEFTKRRPNVVGVLKSTRAKKTLLLSPHLDTVPAGRGWHFNPFTAKIYKGRIYGRGATDCKGNLACGLEALESLVEDGVRLNSNIIFAATVDEETGSQYGLIPLIKKGILKPDATVILDSDNFNIIIAQKGLIHFKITIFGKKAHGAYPWRGINAIDIATQIIQKLKKYKFRYKRHPLLKAPTINIGTIKGGDKVNIVADWCEFEVDLRFLPGMRPKELLHKIRNIIEKKTKKYRLQVQSIQNPYEIQKDHSLVKYLMKANKRLKKKAKLKGSEGATVITFFKEKNIPAIATGFGKTGTAHCSNEYVLINDLYRGAKVLEEFIKEFDKN